MLRNAHEAFGGEANVLDVGNVHERGDERLELRDGNVGDVAAGNDYVAHGRRLAQIVEHLLVAVFLGKLEAQLDDLGDVVADEVHARAVAAVLRTGGKHFGENFCGI